MSFALWLLIAACAVAVATDVTTRRIPNVLTLGLIAIALVLHAAQGPRAFGLAVVVLCGVMALGFVAFSFGWLGGGDVKLLAGGAAMLGASDALPFLLYTAVGGGALALCFAVATGRLGTVVRSVGLLLRPLAFAGTVAVAPAKALTMPYACAIALGAIAVALSHTAAPFLRLTL